MSQFVPKRCKGAQIQNKWKRKSGKLINLSPHGKLAITQ